MNPLQLRILSGGLFYLFIFLSGLWLNRSGAPYGTGILAIHKLIALATLLFLGVGAYRLDKAAQFSGLEMFAVVLIVLLFVGTIATGGLLSTGKPMPTAVLRLHQITPFLTVLATVGALYLLLNKMDSAIMG